MIKASESLVVYIRAQKAINKLAEKVGISERSLYNILDGDPISSEIIGKLLEATGFSFDKAFLVLGDKKDRVKK